MYIWNNKKKNYIVASGLEFSDFYEYLKGSKGLLLLEHDYCNAEYDNTTGFDFVTSSELKEIKDDDIYNYGDFVFLDYNSHLSKMNDIEISELLFFKHKAKPLKEISLENLKNNFLYYSHDNGFYLKLYYSKWETIENMLSDKLDINKVLKKIENGNIALWVDKNGIKEEIITEDIDSLLNKYC